jgi:hypothetical protein
LWAVSYPVRKKVVLDAGFDHGSPLPRRTGNGLRASRTFCLIDCGGPPPRINMTREQLSLPHLQWFKRHLGNKTARAPLSIVTFRTFQ